ncbi:MAG: excinuclease ABC subunit UvrC [Bacteroidales bacterium]|nr:excinuclease ABC subunit UvrC [Bacteroidales bacterium]
MNNNLPKISEDLRIKIASLPNLPGVYQYYDSSGKVIYVGKAKYLKKRVSSYFNRIPENGKTRVLIKNICDLQHIVVDTEEDALLLENNLIKKYQPRYNVLLKDDKSFPWIVIKNEPYPRVMQTRHLIRDGSFYFGPYTSGYMVKTLLELFRQLYPLRTCKHSLTLKNIQARKFKVCLEYHIGRCMAPCIGEYDLEKYQNHINDIKAILKGNITTVTGYMKDLMMSFASEYKFEEAELVKQKLAVLDKFQSKSTVVSPKITNVDVYSIIDDDKSAFINFLKVVNGAIIQAQTVEYRKRLNESKEELLTLAIGEIRDRLNSNAREILVPFMPDVEFKNIEFVIPKIGDKRKLLDLSERNANFYRLDKLKQQSIMKKESNEERIMKTLQKDLRLNQPPKHIECFDNSNIQGTNPVAACVVFINGRPAKNEYRHFNIKTVVGADDFKSMNEIVYRRYKRCLDDHLSLPDLIIIDGGKGQLGAAVSALNDLKIYNIPIIGIAKRLEEIYFPGDPYPLYLDKNSESLRIIQHLRNEAHRFGITFHRAKRSASFIQTELQLIKGIGEKTIEQLLTHFKSVDVIKNATEESIALIIGKVKAKIVYNFFSNR